MLKYYADQPVQEYWNIPQSLMNIIDNSGGFTFYLEKYWEAIASHAASSLMFPVFPKASIGSSLKFSII